MCGLSCLELSQCIGLDVDSSREFCLDLISYHVQAVDGDKIEGTGAAAEASRYS